MKLCRVVLFLMGGITFNAALSADPIARPVSAVGEKQILTFQSKAFPVLKAGKLKTADRGLLHFETKSLATTVPTVRHAPTNQLLNSRLVVGQPNEKLMVLRPAGFDSRKVTITPQTTDRKLQSYPVIHLSASRPQ